MSNLRRLRSGLRIVAAWGVLAAILACGGGGDDDGDDDSTGGSDSFMVRPGFTPDPRTDTGTGGGPFDASTRDQACRGFIGAVYDHRLNVTADFTYLRVVVSSPQDTTLVIQMADGSYRCNDDGEGQGLNPMVEGAFPRGVHRIYVGSYAQGQSPSYTIGVSELRTTTSATLGGGAPGAVPGTTAAAIPTPPTGGTSLVQLRPGFMPDPNTATGSVGGPAHTMPAGTLTSNGPGCRGHLTAAPQHTLMTQGDFANLRVMVSSANDTTLVIRSPTGQWICNDDGGAGAGLNPLVAQSFPTGTYQIWVGAYSAGAPPGPYTIAFSELSSVTPNTL